MAVTSPSKLTITKEGDFYFTAMSANPLQTALANSNHLYKFHTPNLLSFSPLGVPVNFAQTYVVPVMPSVDGLSYDFWYSILPVNSGTMTVTVEANTGTNPSGGWGSPIYPATATASLTANVWNSTRHTTTIASNVRMLRITIGSPRGNYTLGHVAVQPSRVNVTSGFKTSGFIPFDDSLITSSRAAINTEMINRCKTNALSVLNDRQQCLASLVQPYVVSPFTNGPYVVTTPGGYTYVANRLIGMATAHVPGQNKMTAHVYCLASVDGGSTADLVTIWGSGSDSVTLDATGHLVSKPLHLQGNGTQTSQVSFTVRVKANPGQKTYLHSLIVLWQPGEF